MRRLRISDQLRAIAFHWRCPDEARLAAFVDTADDGSILRHLVRCEECRCQVAFLARMQCSAAETQVSPAWLTRVEAATAGQRNDSPGRRWVAVGLVAAAAVVIAAISFRPFSPVSPPTPQVGASGPQPQVVASVGPAPVPKPSTKSKERELVRNNRPSMPLRITTPMSDSPIAPGSDIRWHGLEGSIYYEAQLLSADGDVLWKDKVEAAQIALPRDLAIPAERKCFLIVRAYLPDGRTVESNAVRVVFQPGS